MSRLNNLFILIVAFVFLPFRRRGNNKYETIVIVQTAKLGDMVCTTPMFSAVKRVYPASKLIVVGDAVNKELLRGHKDVDGYVVFSKKDSVFKLIRTMRQIRADAACCTNPNFIALAAFIITRIPVIAVPRVEGGWSPYETKPYKLLRRFVKTVPHRMGLYAPREYLRLLESFGISSDNTAKSLTYSMDAAAEVKALFADVGIGEHDLVVGISPSAGNKVKRWGAEKFAEVARYVAERHNAKIVITGSLRDKEEVMAMVKNLPGVGVLNLLERLSLEELKAAIAAMDIFIGVDTGPIYIAEACGVATIDIVGPMDENEQPPRGPRNIVVLPPERKMPQLHIMNARVYDEAEALRQIESISVLDVTRVCDLLIELIKNEENGVKAYRKS